MIRLPWQKANPLVQAKLDLIDFAFSKHGVKSFADLGGVWGVEGGYTFHALDRFPEATGKLVDTHPTPIVIERARKYPRLQLVQGNFGDPAIAREVGAVDAVFFFDVLLHQVRPDWDEVLKMYSQARCMVIYNQQWTGKDDIVRLLDLGEDEYFRNVPHKRSHPIYSDLFLKLDQPHPDHGGRLWRDVHNIWQWGISDRALEARMAALGYQIEFKRNYGRFGRLPLFENHGFVFVR